MQWIDPLDHDRVRARLGANFARILGYFREDGARAVEAVEMAWQARNAAALVVPAHRVKGEAREFGAHALADLAERIELIARRCVERRTPPEELADEVARLRASFAQTLTALERANAPKDGAEDAAALGAGGGARGGFGRRTSLASLSRPRRG